ncbi:cytochrome P450 [Rhizobium helianthi]|uniref:Cytochrome P450 n=1 Tax=Rhizobium helianthi TaxID=1132695 RepID=A0ABW4LZR7_9HYPH
MVALIDRSRSVDIVDPAFMADPYPDMARWRREGGVHWIESQHAWCLTRYKDVRQALMDQAALSNDVMRPFIRYAGRSNSVMKHFEEWLTFLDQPMHGRIRSGINAAFLPAAIETMRPLIQEKVAALVSQMLDKSDEPDFVKDFAAFLPAYVIGGMLGVPDEDLQRLAQWSDKLVRFVFISMGENGLNRFFGVIEVLEEMRDYFKELIAKRHDCQGDLVIDALIAASRGGAISDHEVVSTCMLLVLAGNDATTMHLTNSIRALFLHPDQRSVLLDRRHDLAFLRNAIRELMRWDSASFLVIRTARNDYAVGETIIPAGGRIYLCLASANRDETVFENPDMLDLKREEARKVITLGQGIHTCLGSHLIYLISEIAYPIILEKLDGWELANVPLEFTDLTAFRSSRSLPLRYRANHLSKVSA